MEESKRLRISALTALARERELTDGEKAEREALRAEYLAEWRRGAIAVLENTYVQTPDGAKRSLRELKEQKKA